MYSDEPRVYEVVMLYLGAGIITAFIMYSTGEMDNHQDAASYIGVGLFWPVFAVKYLVIGVWSVMSAGWGVLA